MQIIILRFFSLLEVKPISLYEHLFNTDSTLLTSVFWFQRYQTSNLACVERARARETRGGDGARVSFSRARFFLCPLLPSACHPGYFQLQHGHLWSVIRTCVFVYFVSKLGRQPRSQVPSPTSISNPGNEVGMYIHSYLGWETFNFTFKMQPRPTPPPTAAISHFKDTRRPESMMTNCTMGLFGLFFFPSIVRSSGLSMYRGVERKPNCPPPPK